MVTPLSEYVRPVVLRTSLAEGVPLSLICAAFHIQNQAVNICCPNAPTNFEQKKNLPKIMFFWFDIKSGKIVFKNFNLSIA